MAVAPLGQQTVVERLDEHLVAAYVRHGDHVALEELIRRYSPRLRRMVISLIGADQETVMDAEQEVFVALVRKIGRFKGQSTFSTFFYRLARNRVLDLLRSRKRYGSRVLTLEEPDRNAAAVEDPEQHALNQEKAALLRSALRAISPEDQMLLYLKDGEDQGIRELAELTGMPEGTIKSRLARGRRKVAEALKELGYDESG